MKKYERKRNGHGYIKLSNYDIEQGTKENMRPVGTTYVVALTGLNIKEEYYMFKTRIKYDFESNKDFKNYIDHMLKLIKEKQIYKVTKK